MSPLASERKLVLAYDCLKDPRDLAEVIHLAAGFGAEVHLLGKSLDPAHGKVLRKLESWRPDLAERPQAIGARRFSGADGWLAEVRRLGFTVVGTSIEGGSLPWSDPLGARVAVLFGEETHGLPEGLLEQCDRLWTIPLGPGGRFYTVGQATAVTLGGRPPAGWIRS